MQLVAVALLASGSELCGGQWEEGLAGLLFSPQLVPFWDHLVAYPVWLLRTINVLSVVII